MGKQISFLMDEQDENRFVEFILRNADIYFEGDLKVPVKIIELPMKFSGKGWFKVYLYRNVLGELEIEKTSNEREIINSTKSPVIEFIRTIVREDDSEIRRGRLWVEMKYYDHQNILIEKSKDINVWYNILSKWIKSNLIKIEVIINNKKKNEYVSSSLVPLFKDYKITN